MLSKDLFIFQLPARKWPYLTFPYCIFLTFMIYAPKSVARELISVNFTNSQNLNIPATFKFSQTNDEEKCPGPKTIEVTWPNINIPLNQNGIFSSTGGLTYRNKRILSYTTINSPDGPSVCTGYDKVSIDDTCAFTRINNGIFKINFLCSSFPLGFSTYYIDEIQSFSFDESLFVSKKFTINSAVSEMTANKDIIIDTGISFEDTNHKYSVQIMLPKVTITNKSGETTSKIIAYVITNDCLKNNRYILEPPQTKCLMNNGKIILDKDFIVKSLKCMPINKEPFFFCPKAGSNIPGSPLDEDTEIGNPANYSDEIKFSTQNISLDFGYGDVRPQFVNSSLNTDKIMAPKGFEISKFIISDIDKGNKCADDTPLGKFRKILANTSEPMKTYQFEKTPGNPPEERNWGGTKYANTSKTISALGCALTSIANSLTSIINDDTLIDPYTLNAWGNENGGYINANVVFPKMCSFMKSVKKYGRIDFDNDFFEYSDKTPIEILEDSIDKCKIPIVHTKKCSHFLIAYDYQKAVGNDRNKDTIFIHDVGRKNNITLNAYNNEMCDIRTIE